MRTATARRWRRRSRRRSRCAAPTIPTRRRDCSERRRRGAPHAPRGREPRRGAQLVVEEQVPDDRDSIAEGDRTVLIVEDDVTFASILLDMARDKGFKGVVATRGESGLQLAQALSSRRDHARHRAARHGRVDGARPPEARQGDAPHPGAHHLRRRRDGARAAARRVRAGAEAGDEGGARRGLREDPGLRRASEQVAADHRGQRAAAHGDRGADRRRRRRRDHPAVAAARRRCRSCASAASTAWSSTSASPT